MISPLNSLSQESFPLKLARYFMLCFPDRGFSTLIHSLFSFRRDAPTFLDVFYVVALVAVLLVVDVFYIGHKHSNELKKMSALHNEEMMEMHARFQEQVNFAFENLFLGLLGSC